MFTNNIRICVHLSRGDIVANKTFYRLTENVSMQFVLSKHPISLLRYSRLVNKVAVLERFRDSDPHQIWCVAMYWSKRVEHPLHFYNTFVNDNDFLTKLKESDKKVFTYEEK